MAHNRVEKQGVTTLVVTAFLVRCFTKTNNKYKQKQKSERRRGVNKQHAEREDGSIIVRDWEVDVASCEVSVMPHLDDDFLRDVDDVIINGAGGQLCEFVRLILSRCTRLDVLESRDD